MGKSVFHVDSLAVALRGKTCQSFVIDVDSQRLVRSDQHVDSQIKFQVVNEQRIGNVSAYDAVCIHRQLADVSDL